MSWQGPRPHMRALGDDLRLQTADNARDIERVAAFNASVHQDEAVGVFTRWKLDGTHPTVIFSDCLFVEDRRSGEIVSSLCLMPQTWTYEGIPLPVGEVSLVGTRPDYRGRGLIRAQMGAIDHMLRARGCLLSCIEGIAYFYKQFGYEYAIPLGSCAQLGLDQVPPLAPGQQEQVAIRRMNTDTDLARVIALYDAHAAELSIASVRDEALWRYQESAPPGIPEPPETYVVEDGTGILGYFRVRKNMWGPLLEFAEAVVTPDRQACGGLGTWLAVLRFAQERAMAGDYSKLCFALPQSHSLLTITRRLGAEAERQYAWQVHVVDYAALLRHIAPALEERLARSTLAGFNGCLDINRMPHTLCLQFARGHLESVAEGNEPQGQVVLRMPPMLLTQLLLGYRDCQEIMACSLDAWVHPQARQLVGILFPKTDSFVYGAT
jgi:GNAT superfamily N-acetyltransferase